MDSEFFRSNPSFPKSTCTINAADANTIVMLKRTISLFLFFPSSMKHRIISSLPQPQSSFCRLPDEIIISSGKYTAYFSPVKIYTTLSHHAEYIFCTLRKLFRHDKNNVFENQAGERI